VNDNVVDYSKGSFEITEIMTLAGSRFSIEGDSDNCIYWHDARECYVCEHVNDGYVATRWFIQPDVIDYIREDWVENGDEE